MNRLLLGLPNMSAVLQAQQGGTPVRAAPRGVPEGVGGLLGGLLGSSFMQRPYQSFNPFGSASASMFDQYMNQAMGPAPFRFNAYQFPALPTQSQQQQQSPSQFFGARDVRPWAEFFGGGGTVGGGN